MTLVFGDWNFNGAVSGIDGYDISAPGEATGRILEADGYGAMRFADAIGAAPASKINDPSGGGTVDSESRTAINALIDALEAAGLLLSS